MLASGESEVLELELPSLGTDCHWQLTVPFECDSMVHAARRWLDKRSLWPGFLDWYVRSPIKGHVSSALYEIREVSPKHPAPGKAGIASPLGIEHHWPGVGEPEHSAH